MSINVSALVFSSRDLQNINVDDGMTVGEFRNFCYGAGYDVVGARTRFVRNGKIHIGRVDPVRLQEDDQVWFETENMVGGRKFVYDGQKTTTCGCCCGTKQAPDAESLEKAAIRSMIGSLQNAINDLNARLSTLR
jgi:hypothetical protein